MPIIKQKLAESAVGGAEKSILKLAQKGYMKYRASEQKGSKKIDEDKEFMKIALDK